MKIIILPRQARDKHKGKLQKKTVLLQAAEVMAAKPRPSYTPVQWGWVDLELHVKKKKEWATPSMQYDFPNVLNSS